MTRSILFDELRIRILVPADLDAQTIEFLEKTLARPAFREGLRRSIRRLALRDPRLKAVRIRIAD